MNAAQAPNANGMLGVRHGQHLYWEEWGDPAGVPALYLHGGPGGGLGRGRYRDRFDLGRTRVIAFDQRGCGRSTPHVSDPTVPLGENTTPHQIEDIEALRRSRGVDAWIVNGVSWGSTLALAYAQAHPERVTALVLAAVTTSARAEVDWITEGVGAVFPEAWERFAAHAEAAGIGFRRGRGRLVEAYHQLVESADPAVRDAAVREWVRWEDTHVAIGAIGAGGVRRNPRWDDARYRTAFVRLVAHYWSSDGFCSPPLLDRMDLLRGVPAVLIHGRRDISGPAITAWRVHRAWPGSELIIVESGGHGGVSIDDEWRAANRRLIDRASG